MFADLVDLLFKVVLFCFGFLMTSSRAEFTSDEIVFSRFFGVGFVVMVVNHSACSVLTFRNETFGWVCVCVCVCGHNSYVRHSACSVLTLRNETFGWVCVCVCVCECVCVCVCVCVDITAMLDIQPAVC